MHTANRSLVCVLWSLLALAPMPLAAQTLPQDLRTLTARPAVSGYEAWLAREIASRVARFSPQKDNLGNVWVTLGSGSPHRLIVAPLDEPGYVVSGITADGYLRVQRLPQQAPNALFDQLYAAQPVVLETRSGKWVNGVIAGLSVHLQPGRRDAPRVNHPDEIYVDIGASSAADARSAGVDLLDPIGLDLQPYALGFGKMSAPCIGDRFGAAVLVELLRRVDAAKLKGTLTVAFVAQQWAGSRGLDRLLQHLKADEMIYVGQLLPRRGSTQGRPSRVPQREPGSGVLIAADPDVAFEGLPAELKKLAEANSLVATLDFSAPLPKITYTQGPVLPDRFAYLGVAVAWPSTPAELIDVNDAERLCDLLEAYVTGGVTAKKAGPAAAGASLPFSPQVSRLAQQPAAAAVVKHLVEAYGVSKHEAYVREAVSRLLPSWAKPQTDEAGNLILHIGAPASKTKTPRILFVAHVDEIGYEVRSIAADGRLEVQSRGGGSPEFFNGHAILVHTKDGMRPGVIELPLGWDQPGFEWPRGPQSVTRVDVGARSPAEVERLGIRVGDWLTVPKRFRKLIGTRASARSFDDRTGCAALVAAVWALRSALPGRDVTFVWSVEEELGLNGAKAVADRLAAKGQAPDYVFAVDTFVSSDSPIESKRFGDAPLGKGFVIRAVDNSNITGRADVDRVVRLARTKKIPVQYGVTGGGNDGAVFLRYGSVNIPIGWPLRYSHSPGEVIDTRDLDALSAIIATIAREW